MSAEGEQRNLKKKKQRTFLFFVSSLPQILLVDALAARVTRMVATVVVATGCVRDRDSASSVNRRADQSSRFKTLNI